MARYRAAFSSTLVPSDAFAYLASFDHAASWDPGVESAERLDDGPVRLGSQFRLVATLAGLRTPLLYKVTDLEPDRAIELTAISTLLRSVDRITVAPSETGSEVVYDADLTFRGAAVVLTPVLPIVFKRIGDRALSGLRSALNP